MKKIIYLLLTCLILIGCNKQETRTNDTEYHQSNFESQLNDSLKAIEFLKEFYLTFYGVDEIKKNRKELLKNYVSSHILKKMDSLSQEDNLVIDYDPFIQGQDYNSESIKKTLEIKPLLNQNEYRVSFLLFGEKNEKATVIDFLLKKNENGLFEINSILNDKYLNFTKNLN